MRMQLEKFWMRAVYVLALKLICFFEPLIAGDAKRCDWMESFVPLVKNMMLQDLWMFEVAFLKLICFFEASHQPICREEWLRKPPER